MKWFLPTVSLFLFLAVSGCNTLFCAVDFPLCNLGGGPPTVDTAPFLGTWLSEEQQEEKLSRIHIFKDQDGYTHIRIWQACSPSDCEYHDGYAAGYPWNASMPLEAYLWPKDETGRSVRVSLDKPVGNRMRGEVTFFDGDNPVEPEVQYFIKLL